MSSPTSDGANTKNRDGWEKADVMSKIVSAFAALLIPIVLVALGYLVKSWQSEQDARRKEDDAQVTRMMALMDGLSSDNVTRRKLAVDVSNLLLNSGKLPKEFYPCLAAISQNDASPEVASKALSVVTQIADKEQDAGNADEASFMRKVVNDVASQKRAFIQIADESQKKKAEQLQASLAAQGFNVPGIQNVGSRAPKSAEIRYFHPEDGDAAKQLFETVKQIGL